MKRSQILSFSLFMILSLAAFFGIWSYFSASNICNDALNGPLCVSDKAIVEKSLVACNLFPEEKNQELCLLRAIPALAIKEEDCNGVALERGKTICVDYVKKMTIAKNKPTPATYRFFDYAQKQVKVTFSDATVKTMKAFIADTDDKQLQGLSLRKDLKSDEAMLFVHKTPKKATYHMRDMLFSIDLVYLNKEGKALNSYRTLPSCVVYTGECALYGSTTSDVSYALEMLPQGKDVLSVEIQQ